MPWYVTAAFVAYAMLLIWQATLAIERGSAGLLALPYLLVKLAVMCVALAYWDHDVCALFVGNVKAGIVLAGALILVKEALPVLKLVLLTPVHPPEYDNAFVALGVVAGVLLPGLVLFFAGSVALAGRCAT